MQKYWAADEKARREKLMPFVWKTSQSMDRFMATAILEIL